jgi:TonB family protein
MKPILTYSCPEKWRNMKIGIVSRFCENCQKDVHDFTKMTREEILYYLWTNRDKQVCGRIQKAQLDYHREEILITIESLLEKSKNSNLAFYLLTAGASILLGCSTEKGKVSQLIDQVPVIDVNANEKDIGKLFHVSADDTVEIKPAIEIADQIANSLREEFSGPQVRLNSDIMFESESDYTLGLIQMSDKSFAEEELSANLRCAAKMFSQIMPEFVGGYDSLMDYMNQNLNYPEWEKNNGIQGIVCVSFIVDHDGKVVDPRITRTVPNAKNLDNAVLQAVKAMPDWIPGREYGQAVAVHYTLPVRFKL